MMDARTSLVGTSLETGTRAELMVENLQKRYGSRVVVKDVSLTVRAGEVVGLLGPNGAGKTTCFYMVVGLVPMDGGSIYLDGKSIAHLPIHRRARMGLSYLPQEASVFRRLTVEENVRAVLELQLDERGRALKDPELSRRLDELLGDLQISHLRTNPRRASQVANAAASRSLVRWPHDRVSSCSMSRSRASIRSR